MSGTSLEITVGGADCHTVGRRSLTDCAARTTGNLQKTDTCIQKHLHISIAHQLTVHLLGRNRTGTAYILIHMMSLKYKCCFCNIGIACIGTASDKYLLYSLLFRLMQRVKFRLFLLNSASFALYWSDDLICAPSSCYNIHRN